MTDLERRMADAMRRLIAKKMLPRAYYLTAKNFKALGRTDIGGVPVRITKAGNERLYSTRGCVVAI